MKTFDGTILIIDPYYISKKKSDWGNLINYENKNINDSLGFTKYFFDVIEDRNNSVLLAPRYISDIPDYINSLEDSFWKYYKNSTKDNEINYFNLLEDSEVKGKIKITSGMIGVFYESEILSYNPDFYKKVDERNFSKFVNFKGDIDFIVDSYKNKHFYGVGNINFLTLSNDI